ncbi:MAG: hypothetical protein BWX98_02483 [Candidatus Aminicenantes bacterium ADurb.Bin147]|nr:MAG: hypothetical protein BWX98_02483 [Candidatus Aminicenantes bacterium ADurb.Bin147]
MDRRDQRSGGWTRPADSVGSSIPVRSPKPKSLMVLYISSAPTRRPIWMVPMLEDSAMIPEKERMPNGLWSRMGPPATSIALARQSNVS